MRWLWIDRIVEVVPEQKLAAIKSVSRAEEYLHDHFPPCPGREAMPVLPASLIIEGMAQTAGILVGAARSFRENVILAKVVSVRLDREALPGDTLRYEATLQRVDSAGAAIAGSVSVSPAGSARWEPLGVIELMFSHVDPANPMPGLPAHNFVFGENFDVLLRSAGLHLPSAPAAKR